jgi:predicted ATPase/DNA-binding SARP family transcriptional activator
VLLRLLVSANRVVPVEVLAEDVWEGDPPSAAASTLQSHVSALRHLLGADRLSFADGGYRVNIGPRELDATLFEDEVAAGRAAVAAGSFQAGLKALEAGLGRWRGSAFADAAGAAWTRIPAASLAEDRNLAIEDALEARLALGLHHEVCTLAEATVGEEPFRERRWAALMLSLYRAGRQADALRAYQRLRSVLGEELGLEPSTGTRALDAAIAAQDPALDLPNSELAPTTAGGLPSGNLTFLFTDVEGSTRLFQRLGDRFPALLEDHRRIVRSAVTDHQGVEVSSEGDGLFMVFADAAQAVAACVDAQRALAGHPWSNDVILRVRMGLHTGVANPTPDGNYIAVAVHQAARIAAAAHGGQVLLSASTAGLLKNVLPTEVGMVERGRFLLKDFDEPQALYQLTHRDLQSSFPPLRASPAIPHSLPDVFTSFVGRHQELAALDELVGACRLVTVVGAGGAGKTRLCLELAARLAPSFEVGAQLADLSPLADPFRVEATIASLYGVQEWGSVDLMQAVGRQLAGQQALLVLDNCEHVLAAASATVGRLLGAAPRLRILATSREPLGLEGEQLWRITPLDVPEPTANLEGVRHNVSVRLFEDRARLAQHAFALDEHNAAPVAAICRHLAGLPLAIELTAARVATMSPATIASRLDSLTERSTPRRHLAHRHRSLGATIDWSYQLLDDSERRLLRFLSVFAGGFAVEAVEAVADCDQPLAGLASLVEKSLVVYGAETDRYHLLVPIRAFALARLQQAGEFDGVARRHLDWFAAFAETVYGSALTAQEAQVLAAAEQEIDNIRAAATWAAQHGELDGLRLIAGLLGYWWYQAPVEGRFWADRMLGAVPTTDPIATGMVLTVQAFCALAVADVSAALTASAEALLTLRNPCKDRPLPLLWAMMVRAMAGQHLPDRMESKTHYLEASELAARTGHTLFELGVLTNLANCAFAEGDYGASVEYAERALEAVHREDCPASMHALLRLELARSRVLSGASVAEAHPLSVEGFEWAARTRSPILIPRGLETLALTSTETDPEGAARLLGAATAIRRTHGLVLDESDQAYFDTVHHRIATRIGQQRTYQLMQSVVDVSLDQAVQLGT